MFENREIEVFCAVPVPPALIPLLTAYGIGNEGQLWGRGRITAWKYDKRMMKAAGIADAYCKPKRCVMTSRPKQNRKAYH